MLKLRTVALAGFVPRRQVKRRCSCATSTLSNRSITNQPNKIKSSGSKPLSLPHMMRSCVQRLGTCCTGLVSAHIVRLCSVDLPRQLVFERNDDGFTCQDDFAVNHHRDASGHDSLRLLFHFVVSCICRNSADDSLRPPFRFDHWLMLLFHNQVRFSDVDVFVDDHLDLEQYVSLSLRATDEPHAIISCFDDVDLTAVSVDL